MAEELFEGGKLFKKNGDKVEETTLKDELKDVKLVGIYFSMHNCPPCRQFTPIFAELYKETNENVKVMEVIFCSGDKT